MKDKVTTKVSTTFNTTKRIVQNAEQFVQAASLLTLVGFSFWATRQLKLNEALRIVVVTSLVVVGLRGMYEFVRFLDKK